MATGVKKDYYKTLGVKRGDNDDAVRKAYRRLARKYHPDVNPGDKAAEDRFKDIQEAYDVLSDEKKRQVYDQFGFYSPNAAAGGNPGRESRPGDFGFSGFDFSEFAKQAEAGRRGGPFPGASAPGGGGGFGDLFSQFFRSNETARQQPQAVSGEDLEYSVDIGFWEAIRGTSVRLNIQRYENCVQCRGTGNINSGVTACTECNGSGEVNQKVGAMRFNLTCPRCAGGGQLRNTCAACSGDGRTSDSETVDVRIPAGAQSGSRLRVPGKGNAGAMGGRPGDLYIITRVGAHALFSRDGDDIRIKVPITVSEAILGGKIEVPTIDGRALLKIPPATSSGKVFRLREKGVLNRRTDKRGDHYIEVQIAVPEVPGETAKDLAREFAKLNPEDPRAKLFEQT